LANAKPEALSFHSQDIPLINISTKEATDEDEDEAAASPDR